MGNYLNISDDAQSLLSEIAKNENDAPMLTICQVDKLGNLAGIHNANPSVHELKDKDIVKIDNTGKSIYLDPHHIEEFQRQFSIEQSA